MATIQRLSPERYDELVNAGVFASQHVELIDGQLIEMSPQGDEHQNLVQWLTGQLAARPELLRVQLPLAVPNGRPEPDLALAPRRRRPPDTAMLVVEIAVTSLEQDFAKLAGYAAAEVPVAWVIDVPGRVVHLFERPSQGVYVAHRVLDVGDTLPSPVDGIAPIRVGALFAVLED